MTTIDTHTIVEELIIANVPKKQAEVLVKRFVIKEELDAVEKEHSELATKADIIRLENATKADIARLENATKADLLTTKTELKADFSRLELRIEKVETNIKWLIAISLATLTILLTPYVKPAGAAIASLIQYFS